jgi:2-methylcitrate dehydratase
MTVTDGSMWSASPSRFSAMNVSRLNINRRLLIAGAAAAGLGLRFGGRALAAESQARPVGKDTSDLIAEFACGLSYDELPARTLQTAKMCLLDTLACMIGALREPDVDIVRKSIASSPSGPCTLVGSNLRASAADAAMLNTGMARVLDFMNTYAGPYGGGHPSNAVGPIMACSELLGGSGKDVLLSLIVSTEILGAFADVINSREKSGIEHVGYVAIAITAGAGKALGLTPVQMKNAVSLTAASYNPLQVTRAEQISMWKGFAEGYAALMATHSALLARNGMVGPTNTFDGRTGWKEVVAREDFELKFTKGERSHAVLYKLYLAETYALSAAEAITKLARENKIDPNNVERIDVRSFSNATTRLGFSGSQDAYNVTTKPEADHSFPYIIAVGLIDGEIGNAQYLPERIGKSDVQSLMKKVHVVVDKDFDRRYASPERPFPVAIDVRMKNGKHYKAQQDYFSGHPQVPLKREQVVDKFRHLTSGFLAAGAQSRLIETVDTLERHRIGDLTQLLSR